MPRGAKYRTKSPVSAELEETMFAMADATTAIKINSINVKTAVAQAVKQLKKSNA